MHVASSSKKTNFREKMFVAVFFISVLANNFLPASSFILPCATPRRNSVSEIQTFDLRCCKQQILGSMKEPDYFERDDSVVRLADGIASKFKVVAFDMDQCIVDCHSRGRLRRDELGSFLAKISPDFIALVPLLVSRNVKLSITTHSDEAEYTSTINKSTHIMGEELVRSVLAAAVPALQDRFEIVAYNPYVRHHVLLLFMPHMLAKKHHIREVRGTLSSCASVLSLIRA